MRIWPFFLVLPCLANDTAFGGSGAAPYPVTTGDVEMVAERIVLRTDVANNRVLATCDFTFRNTSSAPVKLQIGFPFAPRDDEGDLSIPEKQRAPRGGEPVVWDFAATVRGKPVPTRKALPAKNPKLPELEYRVAWLFDVEFAPGETVPVRHTYALGLTQVADGTVWIDYVLKTGGLWKGGRIGRSQLEVHAEHAFMACDGTPYAVDPDRPKGATRADDAKGLHWRWDLRGFTPTEDLRVCLVSRHALASQALYEYESRKPRDEMSVAELRLLRNFYFAMHGYAFRSRDLQEFFGKQPWYRPDPTFDAKRLRPWEVKAVAEIKGLEKARSAPGSARGAPR